MEVLADVIIVGVRLMRLSLTAIKHQLLLISLGCKSLLSSRHVVVTIVLLFFLFRLNCSLVSVIQCHVVVLPSIALLHTHIYGD